MTTEAEMETLGALKIRTALRLIADRDTFSEEEALLIRQTQHVPEVARALAEHDRRVHEARVARARAAEEARLVEVRARIAERDRAWAEASVFVQAAHILAEKVGSADRVAARFLEIAELIENPAARLFKKRRYSPDGLPEPRELRPPPETFRPDLQRPGDEGARE
jgi:hypothetical protein